VECEIDIFEVTSEITSFKHVIQTLEESVKRPDEFGRHCRNWCLRDSGKEQNKILYSSQQATELQSKLWILHPFKKQHLLGDSGTNLKITYVNKLF